MPHETENLEFKAIATDDIYKEVIAFANADGDVFEERVYKKIWGDSYAAILSDTV